MNQRKPSEQHAPPAFPDNQNWDSMGRILAQQRRIVTENPDNELVGKAASIIWQTHHMSGLVVLPTPGVDETVAMHRDHIAQLEESVQVLDKRLQREPHLGGAPAQSVLDVKVSLEAELDWIQTVGLWTAEAPPDSPRAKILQKRQLRSFFIPLPIPALQGPDEVVTKDVIGVCESMVVVKEIQGMKARLIAKLLPVWIEPWFARRRIVGTRIVWCVEWVPAQFIKKIITSKECCELKHDVHTEIIEHPELLDFWRFFPKGHLVARQKY